MEHIYNEFMDFMESSEVYNTATDDLIFKYKDVFKGDKDTIDLIPEIWKKHGLCSYKGGLFSFINPDEFNGVARSFPDVSDQAIVFAKTATGCLFLWEQFSFGRCITFLNVHHQTNEVIANDFDMLLEWNLCATSFWEEDCYGEIELEVIEKYGPLAYDECFAFVPALALGGDESLANMQKVKVKEHLEMLAQLY